MNDLSETLAQVRRLAAIPSLLDLRQDAFRCIGDALELRRSNPHPDFGPSVETWRIEPYLIPTPLAFNSDSESVEFVKDVLSRSDRFHNLDPLFSTLAVFDFRGMGPCEFFFRTEGWERMTTHGKTSIRIFRDFHDERFEELPIGLLSSSKCFDRLGRWANKQVNQSFPIFSGRWQSYYVQAALGPVAVEDWSMFIPQLVLLKTWPMIGV